MTIASRAIVARNAEHTFFEMMSSGYATDVTPARIVQKVGRPSEKVFHYHHPHNEWWGEDRYVVSDQSFYSYGQTVIGCNNTPIWLMQYWGMYTDEAISTLKAALSLHYAQRTFTGGRGPEYFAVKKPLVYINKYEGGFTEFEGKEHVYRDTGGGGQTLLGWHHYHGGLLL